jgi:hypothetical protein
VEKPDQLVRSDTLGIPGAHVQVRRFGLPRVRVRRYRR